jgi:septal ring factor EnvC (AmiA/AmiB activator)
MEEQIKNGQVFLKHFTGDHFYIPTSDQIVFLRTMNFNPELLSLFYDSFFANQTSSSEIFEMHQQTISNLNNEITNIKQENSDLKQEIQTLQNEKLNFEREKALFQESLQKEIENHIKSFKDDRDKWKNLFQKFQDGYENENHDQAEAIRLRLLFLQHLSHYHNIQKEEKEVIYEFQSTLDDAFKNEDEYFKTFF